MHSPTASYSSDTVREKRVHAREQNDGEREKSPQGVSRKCTDGDGTCDSSEHGNSAKRRRDSASPQNNREQRH